MLQEVLQQARTSRVHRKGAAAFAVRPTSRNHRSPCAGSSRPPAQARNQRAAKPGSEGHGPNEPHGPGRGGRAGSSQPSPSAGGLGAALHLPPSRSPSEQSSSVQRRRTALLSTTAPTSAPSHCSCPRAQPVPERSLPETPRLPPRASATSAAATQNVPRDGRRRLQRRTAPDRDKDFSQHLTRPPHPLPSNVPQFRLYYTRSLRLSREAAPRQALPELPLLALVKFGLQLRPRSRGAAEPR